MGAILAYVVSSAVIVKFGWPWVFYIFAIVNAIWLIPWFLFIQDETRQQPVKEIDLKVSESASNIDGNDGKRQAADASGKDKLEIPWKRIFKSTYIWGLFITQYCTSWNYFVMLQWLPTYYEQKFHATMSDLGFIAMTPYLVAMFTCLTSGLLSDYLLARGLVSRVLLRKGVQVFATISSATFVLLAAFLAKSLSDGILYISLAMAFGSLATAGCGVAHLDVNPHLAGVIYGLSNTAATIPGIVAVQVTGLILHYTNSWALVFSVGAAHSLVGAVVWAFLGNPDKAVISLDSLRLQPPESSQQ